MNFPDRDIRGSTAELRILMSRSGMRLCGNSVSNALETVTVCTGNSSNPDVITLRPMAGAKTDYMFRHRSWVGKRCRACCERYHRCGASLSGRQSSIIMPLIHASRGIVKRRHQAKSQPNPLTAHDHAVLEWMGIGICDRPVFSSSVGQSTPIPNASSTLRSLGVPTSQIARLGKNCWLNEANGGARFPAPPRILIGDQVF